MQACTLAYEQALAPPSVVVYSVGTWGPSVRNHRQVAVAPGPGQLAAARCLTMFGGSLPWEHRRAPWCGVNEYE